MQDQIAEVISWHLDSFTLFAWDMPYIDPDFLCHRLTMDPNARPVRQRRRKFNDERRLIIRQETQKRLSTDHIREIQYPVSKRSVGQEGQREVEDVRRFYGFEQSLSKGFISVAQHRCPGG